MAAEPAMLYHRRPAPGSTGLELVLRNVALY